MVTLVVAPIAEVERAAELLLGPHTGEEHAKHRLVVREPRLNRTYDALVHLAELPDPDTGKTCASVPKVEGAGPIAAASLRVACLCDGGGPSHSLEDFTERPTKRVAEGTPERVECSGSSSSSSDERAVSPVEGAEVEGVGRTMSEVDRAIGTFGVTRLAVEESSNCDTSSHVYGGDVEVIGDAPTTPRLATGKHFGLNLLFKEVPF